MTAGLRAMEGGKPGAAFCAGAGGPLLAAGAAGVCAGSSDKVSKKAINTMIFKGNDLCLNIFTCSLCAQLGIT